MRKLMIILGSVVLLLGAACAGSSDNSNDWSASERAELRNGIEQGAGTSVSDEFIDCVTDYVTERHSPDETLDMSMRELEDIGYDAGMHCVRNEGITS